MQKKRYYFLYITTNLVNGKYYKGQHSTDDLFDGYLGSGVLFRRALKKYGRKAFKRQIVLFLPDLDSLAAAEKMYITKQDIHSENCYNCIDGGTKQPGKPGVKRPPRTEEHSSAISIARAEQYMRKKARGEILYKPQINKPRVAPFRDAEDSIRHRGALNPMYGRIGALNATSKPVYCVELGRRFESASLAAQELGLAFQNISKVCQGRRRTCGGYHWNFADPQKDSKQKKSNHRPRPNWYIPFDPSSYGPHQQIGFMNARSRPVVRLDTKEKYGSCGLAAVAVGGTRRALNKALHAKRPYKGIDWMFLEDYERMTSVQHSQEQTLCNSVSLEDSE